MRVQDGAGSESLWTHSMLVATIGHRQELCVPAPEILTTEVFRASFSSKPGFPQGF